MLEIINQKYMQFLFLISEKTRNVTDLAKRGDLTISTASILISRWSNEGVIKKNKAKAGRRNEIIISLSEYGKIQIRLLRKLLNNHKKKCAGEFDSSENSEKEVKNGN